MESFQSILGKASGSALCNVLSTYGAAAPLLTAISLIEPTPIGEIAAVTSGLAGLAADTACTWDTDAPGPAVQGYTGCQSFSEGFGRWYGNGEEFWENDIPVSRVTLFEVIDRDSSPQLEFVNIKWEYDDPNIGVKTEEKNLSYSRGFIPTFEVRGEPGSVCGTPAPTPKPPTPAPYTYEDPNGCSLVVNFKGWGIDQAGGASGIWQIEPAAQFRQGGGIIGGCNFEPVIYVDDGGGGGGGSGGGGGRPWAPLPPDSDPDSGWQELAREIVAGTVGAIVAKTLSDIFETPYSGITYRLVSVCEKDATGEPISEAVEEVIPPLKVNEAILSRLDALVPLLQAQKDFKQPICNDRPTLEGEWRTISFRSEETSPFGSGRLRKRFRYRSVSGIGLEQLVDYWADFSFEAGPVCVIHKGASWGTPQVWASTADEGKRVIRHAGGEAGVDPDQIGQWQISGSDNPRFGVSGTMKVDTTGGYYWITARLGSSERPIVAKT